MKLTMFQIDAFSDVPFRGNPAAIVPLSGWIPDETMQSIAMENQLSETAFFVEEEGGYALRWFTPTIEVDLCGHATLASAHVLFRHLGFSGEVVTFRTRSGELRVARGARGYSMDLPADPPRPTERFFDQIAGSIGLEPRRCLEGREDLVAILESESELGELQPDFREIARLPSRGLLVSAEGTDCDFVSRCFFPQSGIDEDPVTGSAHATLAPFWAGELERKRLVARQLSARGGEIECEPREDRVVLTGSAVTYLEGTIEIPS